MTYDRKTGLVRLVVELPVSESQEPIQWIQKLHGEIRRICNDNDLDPTPFLPEVEE